MRYSVVSAALLFAAAGILGGQSPAIGPGTEVRVWSAARNLSGYRATVASFALDTLTIGRGAGWLRAPVSAFDRVEIRVPRARGWGALRGAGFGALVGLAVGGLAAAQQISACPRTKELCGLNILFVPFGFLVGTPTGAVIGAVVPGKRWQLVAGH